MVILYCNTVVLYIMFKLINITYRQHYSMYLVYKQPHFCNIKASRCRIYNTYMLLLACSYCINNAMYATIPQMAKV